MARMLDPNMQLGCGNGDRVQSEVAYLDRARSLRAEEVPKGCARINFHHSLADFSHVDKSHPLGLIKYDIAIH
jgi:hypothetical protein